MANRIKELAKLIKKDSVVADIGTDHAYLLIELIKNNTVSFCYGIDNKDGPILNANNNIKSLNLTNKIKIIKADGLNFDLDKKVNTLVFAGMGAMNVIEIICNDLSKITNIKYIITDIHRNENKLMSYLINLNYRVDKEVNLIDKNVKYHLVRYIKNGSI